MTARDLALAFAAALMTHGCGCSESYIGGDTGIDAETDTTATEPSSDPSIENLGDTGWRDSEEPYSRCTGWRLSSWDVWSDSRGVFALVHEHNPGTAPWPDDDPSLGWERLYIAFNDGTGWRNLFEKYGDFYGCYYHLTGVPGGDLVAYLRYPTLTCEWEGTEAGLSLDYFVTPTIFVVDETLAYAFRESGLLAFYDGESWGPYPSDPIPYDVDHLWADRSSLFVAGPDGLIMSEEEGEWRVHDTGTLDDIVSIWGFAGDDVWAGTLEGGLLHWDGDIWEYVEWPDHSDLEDPCFENEIRDFWGKDGVLYFHTGERLVRWDGSGFTVIGYWPRHFVPDGTGTGGYCETNMWFSAIWGNDVDEVFISVFNFSDDSYDEGCEYESLLWWDGSEFHWF